MLVERLFLFPRNSTEAAHSTPCKCASHTLAVDALFQCSLINSQWAYSIGRHFACAYTHFACCNGFAFTCVIRPIKHYISFVLGCRYTTKSLEFMENSITFRADAVVSQPQYFVSISVRDYASSKCEPSLVFSSPNKLFHRYMKYFIERLFVKRYEFTYQ